MREINLQIKNEYAISDDGFAGVQGAGNVTALNICFDKSWESFTKSLLWLSATGESAAKILLTPETAIGEACLRFRTLIPPEALKEPGRCSLTVDGWKEGAKAKSVEIEFEVKPAPDIKDASLPSEPTPTQAQQLGAAIDALKGQTSGVLQSLEQRTSELKASVESLDTGALKPEEVVAGDGVSIVKEGKKVRVATVFPEGSKPGSVIIVSGNGVVMANPQGKYKGELLINRATEIEINNKLQKYKPIVPFNLDTAVAAATHQSFGGSYAPEGPDFGKGGAQPVSYNAVKSAVDSLQRQIDQLKSALEALK